MGQYLYKIQPTRPGMLLESTAEEDAVTMAHFNYLKQLTAEGVVKLAGRTLNTDPSSFGLVIFEAESDEAAQQVVDNDPAVSAGVFSAELFPYGIALVNFDGGA